MIFFHRNFIVISFRFFQFFLYTIYVVWESYFVFFFSIFIPFRSSTLSKEKCLKMFPYSYCTSIAVYPKNIRSYNIYIHCYCHSFFFFSFSLFISLNQKADKFSMNIGKTNSHQIIHNDCMLKKHVASIEYTQQIPWTENVVNIIVLNAKNEKKELKQNID